MKKAGKKVFSLLLVLVLSLAMVPVSAFASGKEFMIEKGVLKKYNGMGGSVTIPEGVSDIGDYAFNSCKSLTRVSIPDSVAKIGIYVFAGCTSLTEIQVDPKNEVYASEDGVLFNHQKDTLIVCPAGKPGVYNLPDNVTKLEPFAFGACTKLTAIQVGAGNPAFACVDGVLFSRSKKALIAYPAGRQGSYTVPNGVVYLESYSFNHCFELTEAVLPDTVTAIGMCAFQHSTGLTGITIPASVTYIGNSAFDDCPGLTTVRYTGSKEQWDAIQVGEGNDPLVKAKIQYNFPQPDTGASIVEQSDGNTSRWQDGVFHDGVYEGYYAQLSDFQKLLYNKIKEAFKEPVQKAVIKFDEPIILKSEDGGSFTSDDKYQWMCDNICNQYGGRYAVFRDHPELPWLLAVDYKVETFGNWIYNERGVSVGYKMTGMCYENTYPWVPPEAYTNPSALEKAVGGAAAAIGEARPSRAATVRAIFDYLCGLITYKERIGTLPGKDGGGAHTVYYDHTSYSVMVPPNEGVCNAYAAAFKLMCDRYGIPCVHVSGSTTAGNHAWNYVQMEDGNWYAADLTWADGDAINYSCFLAGKSTIDNDGKPFEITHAVPAGNEGLGCPPLSDTAYPYLEAKLSGVTEIVGPGK